jgi:glucosylceramidase
MVLGSRRGFLKAASATAAVAASHGLPAFAKGLSLSGQVKVWATFRDKRHAPADSLAWKPVTEVEADAIVLDPLTTRQEILGFGAALTDASCYVFSQLNENERQAVMHDLFAPDAMALNVCRTSIGASDYSRTLYSFDESPEPDPELAKFSIDHDKAYILPVLREARKLNPELFLFSSPWSPPGWMKANNSMLGGGMRKLSFAPYARYFLKFLEGYQAEGVLINAVTVQNEVDAEQDGRMPACLWAQEEEAEFVSRYLGPALRKAGRSTKIWVIDHNYNLWGRAIGELSDTAANEYIDGIAWHGYLGEPSAMSRVHDAFPGKSAYWTEGGPGINSPNYATDYARWAKTFNEILRNWSRSITAWNLALDEKGKPNIGPFSCGGTVTLDSTTHKVAKSGQYWAFAHFSRHVRRGAKVIATNGVGGDAKNGSTAAVSHVGFRNPDGSFALVLANSGPEARVQLVLGSSALDLDLPADSVHTLEWS